MSNPASTINLNWGIEEVLVARVNGLQVASWPLNTQKSRIKRELSSLPISGEAVVRREVAIDRVLL